jgi:Amt family ammonium transporter
VVLTVPMLDKLKIDDVVGAIPVHGFAGIWGTSRWS